MKMKTLKEGIITHADSLGELFKFSAEHTCRSMLHSLEGFANMEFVTFKELTAGFFLGFEHYLWASGCSRNTSACYFRALRAICREAEKEKELKDAKRLFCEVFMGYEETRKRALSIELSYDSIRRSNATVVMSISVLFVFVFILTIWEPQASVMALLFECVSALSTVGSSLNLTPTLGDNSKLLVAFLMFIGRVGLITLMLGIIKQKKHTKYQYPSGQIIIN